MIGLSFFSTLQFIYFFLIRVNNKAVKKKKEASLRYLNDVKNYTRPKTSSFGAYLK